MLQALKERTMEYDSFVSTMKYLVRGKMGNGYDIRIYKVIKNNSLELDSLVVLQEGRNIAPNIYLMPYYESYLDGTPIEEIADRLCCIYRHCSIPAIGEDFNYSLQEMKPFIFYRLVSFERNQKLLDQIPHIRFLDLAITFHCLVRNDDEGIGTIRIANEHIKLWGITFEELKEIAVTNTEKLFPASIKSMEEVITGMLTGDMELDTTGAKRMYVLTNQKGINGASCMLYQDVIRGFANQMHSDLFILPSSIHELILLPYDRSLSKDSLIKMVKDINHTQVPDEEVLSDKVYFYSFHENRITM